MAESYSWPCCLRRWESGAYYEHIEISDSCEREGMALGIVHPRKMGYMITSLHDRQRYHFKEIAIWNEEQLVSSFVTTVMTVPYRFPAILFFLILGRAPCKIRTRKTTKHAPP